MNKEVIDNPFNVYENCLLFSIESRKPDSKEDLKVDLCVGGDYDLLISALQEKMKVHQDLAAIICCAAMNHLGIKPPKD